MAASDLKGNKILVKGVPPSLHPDKLTIYFQKQRVGGGDVASVTFPVSTKEPDTAIVSFDDPQTVVSVLKRSHTISGAKLTVTALAPEPEIFDAITAQISAFTIACIKSKLDINEVLDNVRDSTGCDIESSGDSKYAVKGKWYQVQAAFERFEGIVSRSFDKQSTQMPPAPFGYFSRTTTTPRTGPHMGDAPVHPTPTVRPQKVVVSVVIDKDIYEYMKLVHAADLDNIKNQYKVAINTKVMNDAVKVEVAGTGPDADPQSAVKALEGLSTKLNQTVGQDAVQIDAGFPDDELQTIFAVLRPEFPQVHMDRTDSAPDHIMFIAETIEKCKMAMDMFEYYYKKAKESTEKKTGSTDKPDRTIRQIPIDKKCYEFVQWSRKTNLDRIWESNGVEATEKFQEGAFVLSCQLKPSKAGGSLDKAVGEFEALYKSVVNSLFMDMVDLKSFQPVPTQGQVKSVFDKIKKQYLMVYVPALDGSGFATFMALSKENCQSAKASFKLLMDNLLN